MHLYLKIQMMFKKFITMLNSQKDGMNRDFQDDFEYKNVFCCDVLGGIMHKLLKLYINDLKLRNYSEKTIKSYRNANLRFIDYLSNEGISDIEDITPMQIKLYINSIQGKPSYVNATIKRLRAWFSWLMEEELIDVDPMRRVKLLRENKTIINTFSDAEAKRMLDVYNGSDILSIRNKTIIATLFACGVRCSELLELKIEDIKLDYLLIRNTKSKRDRIVPLHSQLRKQLNRYLRARKGFSSEYIFMSKNDLQLTVEAIERIVAKCGELANVNPNIRCSPHTIRHYFCQHQLRNGINVYSLSRVMGHSNIAITNRYLEGITNQQIIEESIGINPLNL